MPLAPSFPAAVTTTMPFAEAFWTAGAKKSQSLLSPVQMESTSSGPLVAALPSSSESVTTSMPSANASWSA